MTFANGRVSPLPLQPLLGARVNYYLVYGTSETERQRVAHRRMVNYYLDYGISETLIMAAPL